MPLKGKGISIFTACFKDNTVPVVHVRDLSARVSNQIVGQERNAV